MSTNRKATAAKRQRELSQKDGVAQRALRRTERKARAAERAATGQVGPEMGEPVVNEPYELAPPSSADQLATGDFASRPSPSREREVRLYVGNLSFDTDTETVREVFAPVGEVTDVQMIMDRDTGRPRGFAFVTMKSAADAKKAIAELDGTTVDGRTLRVNEAEERQARSGGGGGGRGRY